MSKSYQQLTGDERIEIYAMRQEGKTIAQMAEALGRYRTTISREIHRNSGRESRRSALQSRGESLYAHIGRAICRLPGPQGRITFLRSRLTHLGPGVRRILRVDALQVVRERLYSGRLLRFG